MAKADSNNEEKNGGRNLVGLSLYNIMFLLWPGHGGLVSKAISIINKNCSCDSGEELVQSEDSLLYITPLVSFQYGNTKEAIF